MTETRVDDALSFRTKEKTLFVSLHESPGAATLKALQGLLARHDPDTRLFVDLRELDSVSDQDTASLRRVLASAPIPPQGVFFKGTLGFAVAVDGNKVLVERGKGAIPADAEARFHKRSVGCTGHHCHCGGKCGGQCRCGGHCHCHDHHDEAAERQANVAV